MPRPSTWVRAPSPCIWRPTVHRVEGLLVGPGQVGHRRDRPRDPGGEAAPATASVAADDAHRAPDGAHDPVGVGSRHPHRATTSRLNPMTGDAWVAHRAPPGSRPGEPLLEEADLLGVRACALLVVLVGLGDDDDERPVDVPAQGGRVRRSRRRA